MSRQELRILFVEDSMEDVELESNELRKGGFVFRSLRVETREALKSALAEFMPDLIISDYTLPTLDGLSALKIARELRPEVPFIFVSGTLGEERAVERLKEGAADYIVKGRLRGLVRAVERALQEVRYKTEHRELEEQLRQAQKMEAIGRLAGGVAHDFNNLLTAITGYTELVRNRLVSDEASRQDLEEVLKASGRAAALTHQLLAFSRKQVLQLRVLDLNSSVSDMEKMLRRVIGEDIDLVCTLGSPLGRVKADPGQLQQVLLNLALNARDAMPEGGTLTIETSEVDLDPDYCDQHVGVAPGPHVMLAVSDTGVGMSEETKSHLFEPFYTTKGAGKGTGLGLSTAYGIVNQSGGSISVFSEPGKGSTFKVFLPRVDQPLDIPEAAATPVKKTTGSEVVLLVEDSEPLRKLAQVVLTKKGYTLLEAPDGAAAKALSAAYDGPIHLLVTDLVMPRMSGRELAFHLRAARPGLQILYMSGYAEDAAVHHGLLDQGTPFLAKPFTAEGLARKIREVLDGRG